SRRRAARRGNHGDLTADQSGRQGRQSIVSALRPAIFDRYVAALDVADFAQALLESAYIVRPEVGRSVAKEPNHWHRRLLRARRERPRSRSAAEQRDELASLHLRGHSTISSARASSLSGIWRPSAFAVLRLIAISNFTGACAGRWVG